MDDACQAQREKYVSFVIILLGRVKSRITCSEHIKMDQSHKSQDSKAM